VHLGGTVQRTQQRAAGDPRSAPARVDADVAQHRQVDHQAAVGHRVPDAAVPTAAHTDLEVQLARRAHRGHHVGHARGADDHPRPPVHHRVPDRAGPVVSVVTGEEQLPVQVGHRSRHERNGDRNRSKV
jgi:hypothetical protein